MTGPHPAYSNVPIEPDYYQARRFVISDIESDELTTIVTTSDAHDYVIGQNVRLLVPQSYGTYELNNVESMIINIPQDDQFVLNIDSRFFNTFIVNPTLTPPNTTQAQVVPTGDFNSGSINSSGRNNNITYINGSFINISPQ